MSGEGKEEGMERECQPPKHWREAVICHSQMVSQANLLRHWCPALSFSLVTTFGPFKCLLQFCIALIFFEFFPELMHNIAAWRSGCCFPKVLCGSPKLINVFSQCLKLLRTEVLRLQIGWLLWTTVRYVCCPQTVVTFICSLCGKQYVRIKVTDNVGEGSKSQKSSSIFFVLPKQSFRSRMESRLFYANLNITIECEQVMFFWIQLCQKVVISQK